MIAKLEFYVNRIAQIEQNAQSIAHTLNLLDKLYDYCRSISYWQMARNVQLTRQMLDIHKWVDFTQQMIKDLRDDIQVLKDQSC